MIKTETDDKIRYQSGLSCSQVCDRLCAWKDRDAPVVILFHARPDGDAVGSAFALQMILTTMGLHAYCLCADEVPARLRFIMADGQDSVLEASLPALYEGDATKVISVDTASPSQMGALAQRWQQRVDLMIDHHQSGTPYADSLVDPSAAATGELIYDVGRELLTRGLISSIPAQAQVALYAAISSDTGSFRYANVTERTFAIAADLRKNGTDTAWVSHALFESKPYSQLVAEHVGFAQMQCWLDGRVAVIPFSYAMKMQHSLADSDLETLVDVARVVDGVEIVMAVRQPTEEGCFRVSMRSAGAFCVASLCERFGGGGHAKAAGCTIFSENMDTVLLQLRQALTEEISIQNA